jgi:succinyl-diaminopimelate desuccinylase
MAASKTITRPAHSITAHTDLVTLLSHLVRFPTVSSDLATNRAALDWIKYQLRHLPLHVHDSIRNGVPSLVLTTQPTQHPKVLLMAHMDVVPGGPELFELRQENGRLYGRGVFDMKLAIAEYMKLFLELGDRLADYDLGMMITCDEELSGEDGVGHLVRAGWRADVVINPDAGSDWDIERAAKGKLYYRVESRGDSGHGSRPWAYRNAIVQLMAFLQDYRGHFATEPCGDAAHPHDTLTIGTIKGGTVHNQVPDYAEAELDIRVMPGENGVQNLKNLAYETAARYEGITLVGESLSPVFETDPENEYIRLMEHLITSVTGRKPRYVLSHGATDSRYFAGLGIPFILTRPKGGGQHAVDEWVDAKGVEQFYDIIRAFVEQAGKV